MYNFIKGATCCISIYVIMVALHYLYLLSMQGHKGLEPIPADNTGHITGLTCSFKNIIKNKRALL